MSDVSFHIHDQDYHTPVTLGRTQSMTREGFLMVRDVRVGRVGEQVYLPTELLKNGMPLVRPGPDGLVRVQRTADEVFAPMSIKSLNTATFTLNHPTEWVGPENRRTLDMGQVMNARRGEGDDAGFLIADVLVKDADMIGMIRRKEIRDVSAGYGAEYRDLGGGRAEQYKICHNHLAGLTVDKSGRCGGECSIGDHATVTTDADKPDFATSVLSWMMGGGKPATATTVVETSDGAGITALTAAVATLTEKVNALATARTADEAKKDKWGENPDDKSEACEARRKKMGKGGDDTKTGDAAALGVRFATVKGSAEILSPGIKLPIADVMTSDHICNCQRLALKGALAAPKTTDAVKAFGARDIDTLDQSALEVMFAGATELVRQQNNRAMAAVAGGRTVDNTNDFQRMKIPDQLEAMNAANRDFWAKQAAGQ